MQSASGDLEALSSCFQHQEGGSSNPHRLVVEGRPVILIVLRRRDVQASSQSWGEGASSHPHRRAEKSMFAVVPRGSVQSFFHLLRRGTGGADAGAPTTRHGGPVLGHQQTKSALRGKLRLPTDICVQTDLGWSWPFILGTVTITNFV